MPWQTHGHRIQLQRNHERCRGCRDRTHGRLRRGRGGRDPPVPGAPRACLTCGRSREMTRVTKAFACSATPKAPPDARDTPCSAKGISPHIRHQGPGVATSSTSLLRQLGAGTSSRDGMLEPSRERIPRCAGRLGNWSRSTHRILSLCQADPIRPHSQLSSERLRPRQRSVTKPPRSRIPGRRRA